MTLTDKDKAEVVALWAKIELEFKTLGKEVARWMAGTFHTTKLYIENKPNFPEKIMAALGEAVQHIDNLSEDLSAFTGLKMPHFDFYTLLIHVLLILIGAHFPNDLNSSMHAAWVKFFIEIQKILFPEETNDPNCFCIF
ncbi:hypothetical protein GDO86_012153 [Hymenochirus boettgeri]|uniref:Globin domain-containing protein n=1 Tax=Hymenochirus boettgeri TaxID=247094 RepID=A0A8T2IRL4_9PIPI|nr:hypothetical protein GDO86_012153 [Hymenochirus boettgeri]